jgi:polyhydroxyalkanoate synthase
MAGATYKQLINELYKENRLIEGRMILRGERVVLRQLTASVLNVIAESDHITPPCQATGVMERIGSVDKELFRVRGGHIGIMAGSGAENTTWPHIEQWLAARAI